MVVCEHLPMSASKRFERRTLFKKVVMIEALPQYMHIMNAVHAEDLAAPQSNKAIVTDF